LVIEGFFDEISSKNHILFVLNELHHFKENLLALISYLENQRPSSTRHILCLVFSMLEKIETEDIMKNAKTEEPLDRL